MASKEEDAATKKATDLKDVKTRDEVEALVAVMRSENHKEALKATDLLINAPDELLTAPLFVEIIARRVGHPNERVRTASSDSLVAFLSKKIDLGHEVMEILSSHLDSPRHDIRDSAVQILRLFPEDAIPQDVKSKMAFALVHV